MLKLEGISEMILSILDIIDEKTEVQGVCETQPPSRCFRIWE